MEQYISAKIVFCAVHELLEAEKILLEEAKRIGAQAYAPYSNFKVGAACLLQDGSIVKGCNQENASFPAGICAERVAVHAAMSMSPDMPITTIAIAAQSKHGYTKKPISPCGVCRQVLLEAEQKFNRPIKLILYGEENIAVFEKASDLLPFYFDASAL